MTKSKLMIITDILVVALVGLAVFALMKPHFTAKTEAPIFIGNEVLVNNEAKAAVAVKAEKAVMQKTALKAEGMSAAPVTALPIVPPSVISKIVPNYPETALENGVEGVVVISANIGLNGAAEKVAVKTSSGVPALDGSAARAVSQWVFTPASQGGAAIASCFEVPVRFEVK